MDRELSNGRRFRANERLHLLGSMGKEGMGKNIKGMGLGMQISHNNKSPNG